MVYSELEALGDENDSPNCKPFLIPDAATVQYLEVTYSDFVDSLILAVSGNEYSFWGDKKRVDGEYLT